ncbi:hypothetical protein BJV78DRAFT_1224100 [Lactifluus subvellereus]|nr:hypothetical protein BJV78DRAFT_1224100 [Lactifluus subvellereus]
MNTATSNAPPTQPAGGAVPTRQPTAEEIIAARRWVEEQKIILVLSRGFDGVAVHPPVPNSNIQEYNRVLERLDRTLANIETYIHLAYAVLKKEDVVRRLYNMIAYTQFQVKELKKPKPRFVLDIHTIRGMIQEADNMDSGLKTILGLRMQPSMTASSTGPFAQPAPQTAVFRTPTSFVSSGSPAQPGGYVYANSGEGEVRLGGPSAMRHNERS